MRPYVNAIALPSMRTEQVGAIERAFRLVTALRMSADLVPGTLSEMFGEPVARIECPRPYPTVAVTLLGDGIEVRVAVGGEVAALAERMFGEVPSGTHITDLLQEIVNVLMGSVKVELDEVGLRCTSGVPFVIEPVECDHFPYAAHLSLDVGVYIEISARERAPQVMRPEELREGMVLASDLIGERGTLLATAGTRLSQQMLGRVVPMLTVRQEVAVA